jgi:hypothetical protein
MGRIRQSRGISTSNEKKRKINKRIMFCQIKPQSIVLLENNQKLRKLNNLSVKQENTFF